MRFWSHPWRYIAPDLSSIDTECVMRECRIIRLAKFFRSGAKNLSKHVLRSDASLDIELEHVHGLWSRGAKKSQFRIHSLGIVRC